MPAALRSKVALVGVFAVFLIPLWTSSLRGLTHVLTCDETTNTAFSIQVLADGRASILSSADVTPTGDEGLCGGLHVDVSIGSERTNRADVLITVDNDTDFDWKGSMQLRLDETTIPIRIGSIDAGATETEDVDVRVADGTTYEIEGNLLIGP